MIADARRKKRGFIPVSGSSPLSGTGGSSLVDVTSAATVESSASSGSGSIAVSVVVAVGFGGALNTIIDSLSGFGAVNSERASVHSVIVTHLSESALITVIVYDSPASRRSTSVT